MNKGNCTQCGTGHFVKDLYRCWCDKLLCITCLNGPEHDGCMDARPNQPPVPRPKLRNYRGLASALDGTFESKVHTRRDRRRGLVKYRPKYK